MFFQLSIVPETEYVHGSNIKTSNLTSVWLFARNAKASIQDKIDEDDSAASYEISVGLKRV